MSFASGTKGSIEIPRCVSRGFRLLNEETLRELIVAKLKNSRRSFVDFASGTGLL